MPSETTPTTEQRTEYVVFIPDDFWRAMRREVGRYADEEAGEDPGEQRAREHVAQIHRLAAEKPATAGHRAEAFVVKQVITIKETLLAPRAFAGD